MSDWKSAADAALSLSLVHSLFSTTAHVVPRPSHPLISLDRTWLHSYLCRRRQRQQCWSDTTHCDAPASFRPLPEMRTAASAVASRWMVSRCIGTDILNHNLNTTTTDGDRVRNRVQRPPWWLSRRTSRMPPSLRPSSGSTIYTRSHPSRCLMRPHWATTGAGTIRQCTPSARVD